MIAVHKILFWLVVSVLSFLVMVQPVRADGVVSKSNSTVYDVYNGTTLLATSSTQTLACQAAIASRVALGQPYTYHSNTTTACKYYYNGTTSAGSQWPISSRVALVCPANSTGTTTCTCNAGYQPNAGATACEVIPACPAAGTSYSSGWYNVGTVDTSVPNLHPCAAGCSLLYTGGSVSGTRLINGIRNYFARGAYEHTGDTCTVSSGNAVPSTFNALPGSTCAPGQSYIYMAGREKCFNSGTGAEVSTASASAVESAATQAALDAAARALAAASAVQAARDAAAAAGGSASAVEQAGIAAAAQVASDQAQQEQTDPCKDSNKLNCIETGEVPDAEAIQERTIDFSTFAFNTYTFTGTASCPAPRVLSLTRGSVPFSYQPFCDFLNVFKFAALAVAMFVAAMIMLGQRSSDSGG